MTDQISEQQIDNPMTKKSASEIILAIFQFAKKHRRALSIAAAVIILLFAIFSILPSVTINNVELVNLGSTVKITQGQTVKLKFSNVSVKTERFVDDVCPQAGTCYGPDRAQGVTYSLQVNGKGYLTDSFSNKPGADYKIVTVSSDYKTYAEIKIIKN